MKTLKNAMEYWLIKGKETKDGEEFAAWCALSSLMIALTVGFGFLAWFFPIIAFFIFLIVFLPMFVQLYVRFNDSKIDQRLKELNDKLEEFKKCNRNRFY